MRSSGDHGTVYGHRPCDEGLPAVSFEVFLKDYPHRADARRNSCPGWCMHSRRWRGARRLAAGAARRAGPAKRTPDDHRPSIASWPQPTTITANRFPGSLQGLRGRWSDPAKPTNRSCVLSSNSEKCPHDLKSGQVGTRGGLAECPERQHIAGRAKEIRCYRRPLSASRPQAVRTGAVLLSGFLLVRCSALLTSLSAGLRRLTIEDAAPLSKSGGIREG